MSAPPVQLTSSRIRQRALLELCKSYHDEDRTLQPLDDLAESVMELLEFGCPYDDASHQRRR